MAKVKIEAVGREVDLKGAVPLNPLDALANRQSDQRRLIVADKRGNPQYHVEVGYRGMSRQGPDDGDWLR